MIKLILFLCVLNNICGQKISGNKYFVLKNVNVVSNINSIWFINSLTVINKVFCMSKCNSYEECHTIVFSTSQSNANCFLYNKYFELNEIEQSSSSNLYKKECKYSFDKCHCSCKIVFHQHYNQ